MKPARLLLTGLANLCLVLLALTGCAGPKRAETRAMGHFWKNELGPAEKAFRYSARHKALSDSGTLYFAETLRRNKRFTEARAIARQRLAFAPCDAFALSVLADANNPQFGAFDGNDSSRIYYARSAECDPRWMSANLSLWIEGVLSGDSSMEHGALRRLDTSNAWSAKAYAINRWQLGSAPPNAVLFVNGDLDTYPALILQRFKDYRPDVLVVNSSLLTLPRYSRRILRDAGVAFDSAVAARVGHPDSPDFFSPESLIAVAVDSLAGKRPLAFAWTLASTYYPRYQPRVLNVGGVWALQDTTPATAYDHRRLGESLFIIQPAELAGETYGAIDLSPVRRAASSTGFDYNFLELGIWCFAKYHAEGDMASARRMEAWVRAVNAATVRDPKFGL